MGKLAKNNIGKKFTVKGSVYTILGYERKGNNKRLVYILDCNKCSKDKELYPVGSIYSSLSDLTISERIPCGCSKNGARLTEEQNIIRVKRECVERGYEFKGISGEYTSALKTYLILHNPRTGNTWNTTTISNFMNHKKGDPVEGNINIGLSLRRKDEDMIRSFHDCQEWVEGTTFKRSNVKDRRGHFTMWEVYCPSCEKDKYCVAGVSGCTFITTCDNLHEGKKPCRCSKFNPTEKERWLDIRLACERNGWNNPQMVGDYSGNSTRITATCSKGHAINKILSSFIGDYGCSSCAKHGFDKSKSANYYIVRWYNDEVSYLKCGITNRPVHKRLVGQNRVSPLSYEVVKTYHCNDGDMVYECEKYILDELISGVCPKELLPDGYTETFHDTEDNLDFMIKYLDSKLT